MRIADDERVARIKYAVIKVLEVQSMSYHMITDVLSSVFSKEDLINIGNSLRVLKQQGYLQDSLTGGVRFWSCTNKKFDGRPPVNVLVPFPPELHQKISDLAEKKRCSRLSVIIDSVEDSLKNNL